MRVRGLDGIQTRCGWGHLLLLSGLPAMKPGIGDYSGLVLGLGLGCQLQKLGFLVQALGFSVHILGFGFRV